MLDPENIILPETPQEKEEREDRQGGIRLVCDICHQEKTEQEMADTTMGNICKKCMISLQS